MYKNIEFTGKFFLPDNSNNQISGKLIFNENSGIEIEMMGALVQTRGNIDLLHFVSTELL